MLPPWLKFFDIVVLAYLRDEAMNTLELSESICKIQASYGKGILFIFDGWDEFPHNLMNDSFVSTDNSTAA